MQHHSKGTKPVSNHPKRTRLVRSYPIHTLEEIIVIPRTIQEGNAGLPIDRVLLAKALGTTPASSGFTMKLNSCSRYGLTQGGYSDERIELTIRGQSVVVPERESERWKALLDAAVQPEPFMRFYKMLDGKRIPEDRYSENMLCRELGINAKLTSECLQIIKDNGLYVGILGEIGKSIYVSLKGAHASGANGSQGDLFDKPLGEEISQNLDGEYSTNETKRHVSGKIFIGHAGNSEIANYIKTVLASFLIPHEVVECDYDAAWPVSDDVSKQMRQCNSAIFIFADPTDSSWVGRRKERRNEKMLYQLGAASVLYGARVIALREEGASDSQGNTNGFHTMQFGRGNMPDVGLALLAELHRLGVIQVQA